MAFLPPLRARAVTKIFSGVYGIDDPVRRISQQLGEIVCGCDGPRRLLEFVKGVAAPCRSTVQIKHSEVQRQRLEASIFPNLSKSARCPPWSNLPSGQSTSGHRGAQVGLQLLRMLTPLDLRGRTFWGPCVRSPYLGAGCNQLAFQFCNPYD